MALELHSSTKCLSEPGLDRKSYICSVELFNAVWNYVTNLWNMSKRHPRSRKRRDSCDRRMLLSYNQGGGGRVRESGFRVAPSVAGISTFPGHRASTLPYNWSIEHPRAPCRLLSWNLPTYRLSCIESMQRSIHHQDTPPVQNAILGLRASAETKYNLVVEGRVPVIIGGVESAGEQLIR